MAHPHAARPHPHPRRPPEPHRRPGMSFALINGSAFAVHLLLACSASDLMATPVLGGTTLGLPALLLQGFLLVWTAARYDRSAYAAREHGEHGEY